MAMEWGSGVLEKRGNFSLSGQSFREKPLGDNKVNETLRSVYLTRARGPPTKTISISPAVSLYRDTLRRPTTTDLAMAVPLAHDCRGCSVTTLLGGSRLSPPLSQSQSEFRPHRAFASKTVAFNYDNLGLHEGRQTDFWRTNYQTEIARPKKKKNPLAGGAVAVGTLTFGSSPTNTKSAAEIDLASSLSAATASSMTLPGAPVCSVVGSMSRCQTAPSLTAPCGPL